MLQVGRIPVSQQWFLICLFTVIAPVLFSGEACATITPQKPMIIAANMTDQQTTEGTLLTLTITATSNSPVNWLNNKFYGPNGNIYGGGSGVSFTEASPGVWQYVRTDTVSKYAPIGKYYYSNISVENEGQMESDIWPNELIIDITNSIEVNKSNYKVYINGNEVQSDVGFYECNNVVLGPLRSLAEAMMLQVEWNGQNQQIIISLGSNTLVMSVNSTKYSFNDVKLDLPIQPTIIDNRTLVPLQVIVEAFGGTFRVDKGVQALTVNEVNSGNVTVTGVVGTSGATITVRVSGTVIGTGTSQQNGSFEVTIPSQAEGTALEVNATDGIDSKTVTVIVKPAPLPVNRVYYKVYINGNEVQSDVGFYAYNNIIYGPLRCVTEAMELQVGWDAATKQIIFVSNGDTLIITIDSLKYSFNGVEYDLPGPATIYDGRTLIPIKTVVEAFGGKFKVDTPVDECFIATAAFGSKFTWPVTLLRDFRDQYLLTNSWGTAFVSFYYQHSPPIATIISNNQTLKTTVRVLLAPLVASVFLVYHPTILLLIMIMVIFITSRFMYRRYLTGN